ncbi:hypothetical protein EJ06DRAFT_492610 [Trichodelitschia bisporula]|uniref:Mitochondrial import inner membrane translocase subunit TIM54 n=1 Tax=Trichodelitschia bisporula TaxID=703511 RepID=A0A6G1HZQ3_9PEZI|nr:hypothetical protein EJ06DRAFT_492610 [Trichodelitschia bisporula]
MMGMPNFRPRLPSRNWTIFLTIVGTWSGAIIYDRRETKRTQAKWAALVSHLASDPLPPNQLPRRLTVFLSSPPADGPMTAREHFHAYVKPILVAAALDWDAIEGRKEGDVRAALAERIRKARKLRGEATAEPVPEDDRELELAHIRARSGVRPYTGVAGDIVVGRNTWKEYVRGLHEGWLGPVDAPAAVSAPAETAVEGATQSETPAARGPEKPHSLAAIPEYVAEKALERAAPKDEGFAADDASPTDDASPVAEPVSEEAKPEVTADGKPKKAKQPPPFIGTAEYAAAQLSPNTPAELGPSVPIPLPHILGFLNTPTRMWRFLTRRYLADEVGRQVAAAVLGAYRPYEQGLAGEDSGEARDGGGQVWEQEGCLKGEEAEWHKSVRRKEGEEEGERVLLDDVVLDERIAGRMRRFVLEPEEEERARRIGEGSEGKRERVYAHEM